MHYAHLNTGLEKNWFMTGTYHVIQGLIMYYEVPI